jgi:hypothetical protein
MKIIGGKDFYDSALSYGMDESVVYIRHKDKRMMANEVPIKTLTYIYVRKDAARMMLEIGKIILAGKIYRYVVFENPRKVVFTLDDYNKEMSIRGYSEYFTYRKGDNSFDVKLKPEEISWLIENKITIMRSCSDSMFERIQNSYWLIEPFDLYTFQFQRFKNPYEVFQEISMWVGGILPKTGNMPVQITDDKVKIGKHGFDKFSFRKEKEKK